MKQQRSPSPEGEVAGFLRNMTCDTIPSEPTDAGANLESYFWFEPIVRCVAVGCKSIRYKV